MSFGARNSVRLSAKVGTRLTLWGMGVTLVVCAVICCGLYAGLSLSLHREVDGFLEGEVLEFRTILNDEKDESFARIEQDVRRELGSRMRHDLAFRLLDSNGRVAITSDPQDRLSIGSQVLLLPRQSGDAPRFDTLESDEGDFPIRLCSQWATLPDGGEYLIQALYTLRGMNASLAAFRRLCIGAMILAAGLSLLGARLIARRILGPVHRMTVTARQIGTNNLAQRLNRSGNEDEFDRLAMVLNEMLGRLERQFKQIQQFTADAAHELRTPLAALRGSAEVALSSDAGESELRKVLEAGIDEYDRLSRIADDLLLLARADSGRPFLNRHRVCVQAAVQDVADLFSPLAQEKHVSLELDNGPAVEIDADGARIRQVISNLLDNALKYTPEQGRIRISTGQRNGHVELTIADTGPGIPGEHLPHIFDRFYRADAARSRGHGGTGLGLAICRTIIEGHGGTLEAANTTTGALFTIRLPINKTDPQSPTQINEMISPNKNP